MFTAWGLFLLVVLVIGLAGFQLSKYGDEIAEQSGIGGTWVGTALLAAITSLPELATGVSAIRVVKAPDLAAGDILGSCVFNLFIISALELTAGKKALFTKASKSHLITGGFGLLLLSFVALNIFLSNELSQFSIGHIGYYSFVILVLYLWAMRAIFNREKNTPNVEKDLVEESIPLSKAVIRFCFFGSIVVGAGLCLPYLGDEIVHLMGWRQAFMGTVFIAFATSLPEIVVTFAAFHIGAINMAIGNILGSNIFNVLVLSIDDAMWTSGPLFSDVSKVHAISAFSASIMTLIVLAGLMYKPKKKFFRFGPVGFSLFCFYLFNTLVSMFKV